jgi:uncharacterized protein YbcI
MMTETDIATDVARPRGDVLLEVSNAIVRLYKDCYGKGPTKARTVYQGDLVVCLLRGGFTTAERTLFEHGRSELVLHQRGEFQAAMRDRFTALVESIVGRKVIGFMSGSQLDPEMSVEVFVLEPVAEAAALNGDPGV